MDEFRNLLMALFNADQVHISKLLDAAFTAFDLNKDNYIDLEEFERAWTDWFPSILDPVSALIVLDVQNDFITGTLALRSCPAEENGADVVPVVNSLVDRVTFDTTVFVRDWHPQNHISFHENADQRKLSIKSPIQDAAVAAVFDEVIFETPYGDTLQKLWPAHCIQNTWGSEFHSDLKIPSEVHYILKGDKADMDCYSGFGLHHKDAQTDLHRILTDTHVTDVFICGLATDICVATTCLDALQLNYRVILIEDACRGVSPGDIAQTKQQLLEGGAIITTSDKVQDIAAARVRPIELAYRCLPILPQLAV